jgi:hypothetical protein
MLDYEKLCRIHTSLLDEDPGEDQERLYRAYPKFRGYAYSDHDHARFQATFVLGLAQTYSMSPEKLTRTAFLVSPVTEKWALARLDQILREIFDRCRKEAKIKVARFLGGSLENLLVGNRVLQIEEPVRWAAYGFDLDMPLPDWMKDALLTGV